MADPSVVSTDVDNNKPSLIRLTVAGSGGAALASASLFNLSQGAVRGKKVGQASYEWNVPALGGSNANYLLEWTAISVSPSYKAEVEVLQGGHHIGGQSRTTYTSDPADNASAVVALS